MKEFYELQREKAPYISISRNVQHDFIAHFHNNIEIYVLKEGEQKIICNGQFYEMSSGTVAFFDSYDIHGYIKPPSECKDNCVLIIPFSYLTNFRAFRKKLKISCPVIYDMELAENLLKLIDGVLAKTQNKYILSATVDMILAFIEQKLDYSTNSQDNDVSLVKKILEFIYANFKTDTKLSTIARHLGYSKEHLSREFHKIINQSIPSYVNKLRIDYVESELNNGKKLADVIFDVGFNNIQTYYRNKKAYK